MKALWSTQPAPNTLAHSESRPLLGLRVINPASPPPPNPSPGPAGLGTTLGVFVPCLVQIFGLTVFVRLPFILGQAGFVLAVALYLVALCVALLTLCSLCALVTNGDIAGGGAYFLISRGLGAEFGGSIGVGFFLANLISVTAYCNVITTQLQDAFSISSSAPLFHSTGSFDDYLWYTFVLAACTAATMGGAQFVARASIPIIITVLLAIYAAGLSLLTRPPHLGRGGPEAGWASAAFTAPNATTFAHNTAPAFAADDHGETVTVAVVFGLVFPSCTGMMSGVAMSADLAEPQRSIPRGTLGAYAFSMVHIFGLMLLLAMSTEREAMVTHTDTILGQLCFFHPLLMLGLLGAVAASAVSCLSQAARLLQAMALDRVIPLAALARDYGCADSLIVT